MELEIKLRRAIIAIPYEVSFSLGAWRLVTNLTIFMGSAYKHIYDLIKLTKQIDWRPFVEN